MTFPHRKRFQRMGWMPRDGETWDQFYARKAKEAHPSTEPPHDNT